ncbi:hypothetical protein DAI22_07g254700 [Oryza sativa Japonica Group]|uniref:cDNA, clone: J065186P07, full insert sequence n=1 Tax=Oryza sativa subsp. japonica TaxID=39947 RepID=B7F8X0_ORYSJ|nr:hypothetical protein DAI22_07g254700 [Oryza sativa Japonica Group]BAH01068.1 unnamed protein product [Oryza sativa Japonica Group]
MPGQFNCQNTEEEGAFFGDYRKVRFNTPWSSMSLVSPFYLSTWLGIFELCAFVVVQLHHRYDFREEIKLVYYKY